MQYRLLHHSRQRPMLRTFLHRRPIGRCIFHAVCTVYTLIRWMRNENETIFRHRHAVIFHHIMAAVSCPCDLLERCATNTSVMLIPFVNVVRDHTNNLSCFRAKSNSPGFFHRSFFCHTHTHTFGNITAIPCTCYRSERMYTCTRTLYDIQFSTR